MNIAGSRLAVLAWLVNLILCIATPLQHFNEKSSSTKANGVTEYISTTHISSNAPKGHRKASSHMRRGGGGSAAASVALGNFQLETKSFKTFTVILPSLVAARYITDFLEIVAFRIETGFWDKEPPSNHRVIHMWNFELTFQSLDAVIPWDFIQTYVIALADDVAQGFVATFDEHMMGLINGVATAVIVRFKVKTKDPPMVIT